MHMNSLKKENAEETSVMMQLAGVALNCIVVTMMLIVMMTILALMIYA